MKRVLLRWAVVALALTALVAATSNLALAEDATPIPTVTSTPMGTTVVVLGGGNPQINVRAGPGGTWPVIGVLVVGERVPAIGRSPMGEWITLAAQFLVQVPPTRLPTFTPPPPLVVPTFSAARAGGVRFPSALVIFGLFTVGIFGILVSFWQRH